MSAAVEPGKGCRRSSEHQTSFGFKQVHFVTSARRINSGGGAEETSADNGYSHSQPCLAKPERTSPGLALPIHAHHPKVDRKLTTISSSACQKDTILYSQVSLCRAAAPHQ